MLFFWSKILLHSRGVKLCKYVSAQIYCANMQITGLRTSLFLLTDPAQALGKSG